MKKGFTLIELIISIALYSIILVMISSTFFAVAKLGDMISNNSNSKSEIYLLEKIIKKELYSGSVITTDEDYLFDIDGDTYTFNEHQFIKNDEVIFSNQSIIDIEVKNITDKFISVKLIYELNGKVEVILIQKMIT